VSLFQLWNPFPERPTTFLRLPFTIKVPISVAHRYFTASVLLGPILSCVRIVLMRVIHRLLAAATGLAPDLRAGFDAVFGCAISLVTTAFHLCSA